MRDIPIIFSAPMVQALLAGRKTQTRRLAWSAPVFYPDLSSEMQEDFDVRGYDVEATDGGCFIRKVSEPLRQRLIDMAMRDVAMVDTDGDWVVLTPAGRERLTAGRA